MIYLLDHRGQVQRGRFGARLAMFSELDSLEKEPIEFWRQLLHRWLLQPHSIETIMKPSIPLAKELQEKKDKQTQQRINAIGKR
jgi:Zn-dependent M16 (insulinase) family peptidase